VDELLKLIMDILTQQNEQITTLISMLNTIRQGNAAMIIQMDKLLKNIDNE
jgi:hypothetical protein